MLHNYLSVNKGYRTLYFWNYYSHSGDSTYNSVNRGEKMRLKRSQIKKIILEAIENLGMDQEGEYGMLIAKGMSHDEAMRIVAPGMFEEEDDENEPWDGDADDWYEERHIEDQDLGGDDIVKTFITRHPHLAGLEVIVSQALTTGVTDASADAEQLVKIGSMLARIAKADMDIMTGMVGELGDK